MTDDAIKNNDAECTGNDVGGLTIGAVVRRTGLTERALRHYEAAGLLCPGRSTNGRRVYQRQDLERLARVQLLKKAGFKVAQIRMLLDDQAYLKDLIEQRLDVLRQEVRHLQTSVSLLSSVNGQLEHGDSVDAETLCALIKNGERTMLEDEWRKVYDRYYTKEEQAEWIKAKEAGFKDFDMAGYERDWVALTSRIADALPMDPASPQAQQFLTEWNKLLEPFMQHATPGMLENVGRLYDDVGAWGADVKSPVTPEIWSFIKEASKAHSG